MEEKCTVQHRASSACMSICEAESLHSCVPTDLYLATISGEDVSCQHQGYSTDSALLILSVGKPATEHWFS